MNWGSFFRELKERRVIRAVIIYVALVWVVLQVADLLAGAEMLSEQSVRWLIVLGVAGLPVTLLLSWFLDAPWRQRKWHAVAGDVVVILAVSFAGFLFAWQQWFTSFVRPVVAVIAIEATDTRDDTAFLAAHLGGRLREILAVRGELQVVDLASSQHAALAELALADRAEILQADYLLTGTLAQNASRLRLNLQMLNSDGTLLWAETYEDRLLDLVALQNRILADLQDQLPMPARDDTQAIVAGCDYPEDGQAIRQIAATESGADEAQRLAPLIRGHESAGMLHLAYASALFAEINAQPVARQPVMHQLAMQHLGRAATLCRGLPEVELLRLKNTLEVDQDSYDDEGALNKHPNSAWLHRELAGKLAAAGRDGAASALAREAWLLDPATNGFLCEFPELLESITAAPQVTAFGLPDCK